VATKERIREAVSDPEWQKFRLALKGTPTMDKLEKLKYYLRTSTHSHPLYGIQDVTACDVCIQVDNYIKALCRGGQLFPGASLQQALDCNWKLGIRKS
jgi:hypothetical protein